MTSGREWTDEQREAIARREGGLLLDAAAGSGKTSVLVERFAADVVAGGIEVGAILAITFTEKAAAELRDRIRARLRELGAADAARATEGAWISTIHGFCARVLRAGAVSAGVDPAFVVLDADGAERLARDAFEAALTDLARAGEPAEQLLADYGAGTLQATVAGLYGQLRSRGERHPRLPELPAPTGDGPAPLIAAARAVAAELGAIADPGVRVITGLARLQRCLDALGAGDAPSGVWPGDLRAWELPRNGPTLSTDACTVYREALSAYAEHCALEAAGPVRDLLDRLLSGFADRYEQAKRDVSAVDFEDLELLTRDLLRDQPAVRAEYAERFERVMVDEFQDTNRVQLELIASIAGENLFTVGDAQQSIYRFRHAEVELFERRGAELEAAGCRATLATNFRSRSEILDVLNAGFADALGERFRPLRAGRTTDTTAGPSVELLLVDKGADWDIEGLASPWRLAEARMLARHVAALVASGTRPGDVVVLMRATTDMRAYERALEREGLPTYVIGGRGYWTHPQVLDLVAYLRVLANPHDEEALHTVLASPLVGASLDALVLLAAAARAQKLGVWAALRASAGDVAGMSATDRDALAAAASWLPAERERARRGGLDELIDAALRRTGYDLAMLAMPGGRRRLANVRKLMRLARAFEAEHGPDLRGFADLAADRAAGRAGSSREAEAPIEGEGLDAVRLMTIHRAKGLEFDVVCVADLGRSVRPGAPMARVSADGRIGLRLRRAGAAGAVSTQTFDALREEEKTADEAEERRLFYVAMTRAREHLILSGATKFEAWTEGARGASPFGARSGGGPVAWIAPAFVPELGARIAEGGGEQPVGEGRLRLIVAAQEPEPVAAPVAPAGPPATGARSPLAPPAVEVAPLPAGPAGPPLSRLSYSALEAHARCGYRFYVEQVLGLPPVESDTVTGPGRPDDVPDLRSAPAARRSAAERGILLHALLEGLNLRRPLAPDRNAVRAAAQIAGLDPVPDDPEADALIAAVAGFASSALCARLGRATAVQREQRFGFPLRGGVLMTGAVDLLAREGPGRLLICDYKSDRLGGAEPAVAAARDYAVQRQVYGLAGLHAGARTVEVVHCYLERPDEPAAVVYEAADRERLDAAVSALAAGVLDGDFAVTEVPHRGICAGCPAQGGLCAWPEAMTRRAAPDRLF